jgi:ankyrin repeat protein
LHFAADESVDLVRLLLSARANVDQPDIDGMAPLMVAAKGGHLDIVDALVAQGADVRAFDKLHHGVLHWSAVGGDYPELNGERRADPTARTEYGKSYLDILSDLKMRRLGSSHS